MSCRLCKAKSHIPLSCDEFKKENGISERRVIEEARTEALIRTCGKCKVRILKEDGCNKVICTKCYAVLCDYCGKDISKQMYNHFDGQGRAPPGVNTDDKTGKCPLYDESHKRKDQQVDKAEKEAMAKVRAEHPDLSEEDLKIKFSKGVQSSNNRHPGDHHHHGHVPPPHIHHRHYRVPDGAILIEGVGNILGEIGVVAPPAVQQARDQELRLREHMRIAHQQAFQRQVQYQREIMLRQQHHAIMVQQEVQHGRQALRDDLQRRLEQARRTAGPNEAVQPPNAMTGYDDDPVFRPWYRTGLPQVDALRPAHNNQAFGNNGMVQNVGIPDGVRAREQPNEFHRNAEERMRRARAAPAPEPPTRRRESNDFRRRTAEFNAERTAERAAGPPSFNVNPPPYVNPWGPGHLPQMPGEYPGAQRGRDPVAPANLNPWVAGANEQAYL